MMIPINLKNFFWKYTGVTEIYEYIEVAKLFNLLVSSALGLTVCM